MIKKFFPTGIILLVVFGSMYIIAQQILRQGANEPQIQMSYDLARDVASGNQPIFDQKKVDLAQSPSPFVIVLDDKLRVTASNALLDGKTPIPPKGVFDFAKTNPDDRVTYQPKPGVRMALVVKYFDGKQKGYVAVGRSLTEVEKRSDQLLRMTGIGLVAAIAVSLWFSIFKWG